MDNIIRRWIRTLIAPWRLGMGLTTGYARHTPNDPAGGILGILDPIGEKGAFNGGEIRYEHRHFLPLGPVLTLAHRAMGTLTFGDVPFFEQPKLGSSRTVRGLPPARVRGEGRILLNAELRWHGIRVSEFRNLYLGGVLFTDAGQAFDRSESLSISSWRSGVGAGLRVYWHSAIMRIDVAGSSSHRALYTRFSQAF